MKAARAAHMYAVGVATGAATVGDLDGAGAQLTVTDLNELAGASALRC